MPQHPNAIIFDRDPLLVEFDNQREYGETILKSLLVDRTLAICAPSYINLLDQNSRDRFEKRPKHQAVLAAGLAQRYLQARITRTALSQEDRDALEELTMACRPDLTAGRWDTTRPNPFPTEDIAALQLQKPGAPPRLKIAVVGFRVKISRFEDRAEFSEDLKVLPQIPDGTVKGLPDSKDMKQLGRTRRIALEGPDHWADTIVSHIKTSIKRGSHIVLLPEFALPPRLPGRRKIEGRIATATKSGRGANGRHFVFAGTRHEGSYNRGLIIERAQDNVSKAWWHYKVASAKSLGENILGPYGDKFPSYSVTLELEQGVPANFQILVAICYDTFDPTMFLNLVLQSMNDELNYQDRIILVPSFNPSRNFVELLRDLSFLAQCTVIYVDGLHGDAKMYICGMAISDLRNLDVLKYFQELDDRVKTHQRERTELTLDISSAMSRGSERDAIPLRARVGLLSRKLNSLKLVKESLKLLHDRKSLSNLITVERCKACEDRSHRDDYHCGRDILYYNIDPELIAALSRVRRVCINDDVLPTPFQTSTMLSALKKQQEKQERRLKKMDAALSRATQLI